MSSRDIRLNIDFVYFFLVIGILESLYKGYPLLIGIALGIVFSVLIILGVLPVVGQIAYWLIARYVLLELAGYWFGWLFWAGLVSTVIISILVLFVVILPGGI